MSSLLMRIFWKLPNGWLMNCWRRFEKFWLDGFCGNCLSFIKQSFEIWLIALQNTHSLVTKGLALRTGGTAFILLKENFCISNFENNNVFRITNPKIWAIFLFITVKRLTRCHQVVGQVLFVDNCFYFGLKCLESCAKRGRGFIVKLSLWL